MSLRWGAEEAYIRHLHTCRERKRTVMIEGMRGAGGRIIPYVLQCVACGSVWVGGYLHGPPKPCSSQHRLSGNRAPSS